MEKMTWISDQKFSGYSSTEKTLSDRIYYLGRLLASEVRCSNNEVFKTGFERLFTGESNHSATNSLEIERVDDQHVKIRDLYYDENIDEEDIPCLIIDRDQLYYLMDEWARLSRAQVNEITITYNDGKYTIEGK